MTLAVMLCALYIFLLITGRLTYTNVSLDKAYLRPCEPYPVAYLWYRKPYYKAHLCTSKPSYIYTYLLVLL
jgi:hypothetical protein